MPTDNTNPPEANQQHGQLFAQINVALNRATDEKEIMRAIDPLIRGFGITWAAFNYTHLDQSGQVSEMEVVAVPLTGQPGDPILVAPHRTRQQTPLWDLLLSQTPLYIADITTDSRADEAGRSFAAQLGLRAVALLPLHSGARWQGNLALVWKEPHPFSDDETRLYSEIAHYVSPVVGQRRAYQLQQKERYLAEILATIHKVMSQATNEDDILDAVASYIGRFNPRAINLSYLTLNEKGRPVIAKNVAVWEAGRVAPESPLVKVVASLDQLPISDLWIDHPFEGLFVEDITTDPRANEPVRAFSAMVELRSIGVIPLFGAGRWQGLVSVTWNEPHQFSDEERYIYTALMRTLSSAVGSRRAYLLLEDKNRELEDKNRELEDKNVELILAIKQANEAARVKSEFLATMSHELRTPLNTIIGFSVMMANGLARDPDRQTQMLREIEKQGKTLLGMINSVLDLTRLESGQMKLVLGPENPAAIIEEATDSLQAQARNKNLDLLLEIRPTVPQMLMCDALKIKQVVTNLLDNAIKFTEKGKVSVVVDSDLTDPEVPRWNIKVQDTGIGIPEEAQGYIFEQFRQVDGSDTRKHGGSGLGLAIAGRFVQLMGGSITVQSHVGDGSTFTVSLLQRVAVVETEPVPVSE